MRLLCNAIDQLSLLMHTMNDKCANFGQQKNSRFIDGLGDLRNDSEKLTNKE